MLAQVSIANDNVSVVKLDLFGRILFLIIHGFSHHSVTKGPKSLKSTSGPKNMVSIALGFPKCKRVTDY